MSNDILVVGATGKTGSALARRLHAAGINAVGMTSRQFPDSSVGGLPFVYGDLRKPQTLAAAFRGVRSLYLVTPLGADETTVGLEAIRVAEQSGIEKIVYLSIMNLETMREIPHFESKIPIESRLMSGGLHVVLNANFFMQNDVMALPAILQRGVYPLPVGRAGVWSIDVEDIALAAFNALTDDAYDGCSVPLAGPECLSGQEMARIWTGALGRGVAYGGDHIDSFIATLKRAVPLDAWAEQDFRIMMAVTQRDGCPASETERRATRRILGREATTYAAFVQRTVADFQIRGNVDRQSRQ